MDFNDELFPEIKVLKVTFLKNREIVQIEVETDKGEEMNNFLTKYKIRFEANGYATETIGPESKVKDTEMVVADFDRIKIQTINKKNIITLRLWASSIGKDQKFNIKSIKKTVEDNKRIMLFLLRSKNLSTSKNIFLP